MLVKLRCRGTRVCTPHYENCGGLAHEAARSELTKALIRECEHDMIRQSTQRSESQYGLNFRHDQGKCLPWKGGRKNLYLINLNHPSQGIPLNITFTNI
jgi:hypothetical protein